MSRDLYYVAGERVAAMLEPLIVEHGIERVQADLARLLGSCGFSEWQTVSNIARNVHNQLERQKAESL